MLHLLFNRQSILHTNIQQSYYERFRIFTNISNKTKFSRLNFFQCSISSSFIKWSYSLHKLICQNSKSPHIHLFIIFFSSHYFRAHIIQCTAVGFSSVFASVLSNFLLFTTDLGRKKMAVPRPPKTIKPKTKFRLIDIRQLNRDLVLGSSRLNL